MQDSPSQQKIRKKQATQNHVINKKFYRAEEAEGPRTKHLNHNPQKQTGPYPPAQTLTRLSPQIAIEIGSP